MAQKIWFITGISSGFGASLAQEVIATGDFVIGTFRDDTKTQTFNQTHTGKAFAYTLDITQITDLQNVVNSIIEKFGRIDVLVNNAGYGFAGAVEEATLEEVRKVFEANVFGTLALTQAVLPILRSQKSGHIIQMSSHGGIKAFAGFGIYNASKFALEGFSEAMAQEVAPLGIKVTIVEPGPFRTNFAGNSFHEAQRSIEDYQQTSGVFRQKMQEVNGKQEGDPIKASKAIIKIVNSENPPLRLPLGKVPMITIAAKLASVQQDLDNYREVAESVVF
ncbi:MAG: oxidoreductase [Arcicella sp.]|jgi:NAD(P)-dependent dehydrogenase (short-subunit alcohol dehydrogenase family)|nr:oxidoreductase [Arcicella sp.]